MCVECGYEESGSLDGQLMNKIIMWNHVKKAHPRTADRIMRSYQTLPNNLYDMAPESQDIDEVEAFSSLF